MSIVMKALKDFRGRQGEGNMPGNDRLVEAGPEFNVASQKRADELESRGFAVPARMPTKPVPAAKHDVGQASENPAAAAGPLPLAGGETGAETAPSSSPPARQPRRRGSRKPAGALDL